MNFGTIRLLFSLLLAGCAQEHLAERGPLPPTPEAQNESLPDAPSAPNGAPWVEPALESPIPYPFVFLHGMAGFIELGPLEYWADIINLLNTQGHDAYPLAVEPFATMAIRAQNAAQQIDEILESTGAQKVHLLGHSQGGLDGRYIISTLGYADQVASLTTIASPHQGVSTIDAALGLLPDFTEEAIAAIFDAIAETITDYDSDLLAQLEDMSVEHVQNTFNPNNPDAPNVQYYSIGGRTQASPNVDTSITDVINPLFIGTFLLGTVLEGENDGLVSITSAQWGTYLGTAPADHLDEIGMFPATPVVAFDYLTFYSQLANFLANQGPPPVLPQ
ncbi:MAG: triacylglycerol lipase [Myxococcota bacterium]|jgi:triacylglycerol lipase|nr:triacylglycerol lipase [Myxococcota bacterium]